MDRLHLPEISVLIEDLLEHLADRLSERTGATVVHTATKNAAIPCEDQVLGLLAEEVDVILTGTAD